MRHVGYGNAARYLGVGLGNAAGYEDDNSSEGEEAPLDPAPMPTSRPPAGDGMTDEEKDAEAARLLDLFARLERTGVVRVGMPPPPSPPDSAH
jgi:hypothetical protein